MQQWMFWCILNVLVGVSLEDGLCTKEALSYITPTLRLSSPHFPGWFSASDCVCQITMTTAAILHTRLFIEAWEEERGSVWCYTEVRLLYRGTVTSVCPSMSSNATLQHEMTPDEVVKVTIVNRKYDYVRVKIVMSASDGSSVQAECGGAVIGAGLMQQTAHSSALAVLGAQKGALAAGAVVLVVLLVVISVILVKIKSCRPREQKPEQQLASVQLEVLGDSNGPTTTYRTYDTLGTDVRQPTQTETKTGLPRAAHSNRSTPERHRKNSQGSYRSSLKRSNAHDNTPKSCRRELFQNEFDRKPPNIYINNVYSPHNALPREVESLRMERPASADPMGHRHKDHRNSCDRGGFLGNPHERHSFREPRILPFGNPHERHSLRERPGSAGGVCSFQDGVRSRSNPPSRPSSPSGMLPKAPINLQRVDFPIRALDSEQRTRLDAARDPSGKRRSRQLPKAPTFSLEDEDICFDEERV